MDDSVFTPQDRSRYTLAFAADGKRDAARRLQSRHRHLDVAWTEPVAVRPHRRHPGDVSARLALRTLPRAV